MVRNTGRRDELRVGGRGVRVGRAAGVVAMVVVLAGSLAGWKAGFSQQADRFDVHVSRKELLEHLNTVIQYYQTTKEPIQKAGEPNDVVYRDQAVELSAQVAQFAFQSAKAQAELAAAAKGGEAVAAGADEQQRIDAAITRVEGQITDLNSKVTALDQQMAVAKPKALAGLESQKKELQGALDLTHAMKDALEKIVGMAGTVGGTGLAGDIAGLQGSIPEAGSKNKTATSLLTTIDEAQTAGVTSQAAVLIDLVETRRALEQLLTGEDELHQQAIALRTPLLTVLRALIAQGTQISVQTESDVQAKAAAAKSGKAARAGTAAKGAAAVASGAGSVGASSPEEGNGEPPIQMITKQFKALSAATVPLSQEVIVLEQSRANLLAWQTSVTQEYDEILHALLLRILVILIALAVIFGGGEIWRHATNKYVQDLRRRRQLLVVRRVIVGFLSAIVILFGFISQFNSLATFAGFITAGIAVGLQTILLSVAAYFFIIGRYGIKVGDRITIASVTGDVIDVGLVRFYMMELAGTGLELNPTGRVAVFSNAVLFQAVTPLYKQIPGTRYAWHELTLKLNDGANYKAISEAVMKEVNAVYEEHRVEIEQQHRVVETHLQIPMMLPAVESRFQLNAGAFVLWVRFPVSMQHAAAMDETLTEALVDLFAKNPEVKSGVAAVPVIAASVRG